jgi:hypothetical protein
MRNSKITSLALAGLLAFALAVPVMAADKTITGQATCAKCALKESDTCQTVIQVEGKNGKTVNYYLVDNDKAKAFHENICKEPKKVTATGTVKTVDGKKQFTVTDIKLAD